MSDITTLMMAAAGAGGAEEADPNFNQTVLLLHGDNTNGAQNNTFLDSSTNNFTITRNGNTTQGTFSPFSAPDGRWSNYFSGSSSRIYTSTASADLNLSGSTHTIEAWIWSNAHSAGTSNEGTMYICGDPAVDGASNKMILRYRSTNIQYFLDGTAADINITVSSSLFPINQWNHLCCTYDHSAQQARMFINGVLQGYQSVNCTAVAGTYYVSLGQELYFGLRSPFAGYISNARIIKGSIPSEYQTVSTTTGTSVFTPPTGPLSAVANTVLVTSQSNRFVDNSTSNFALVPGSGNKVTPFSPFAPTAAYSPSVNGGSGYFDGTGDYLTLPNDTNLNLESGDFTVECWFYTTNASATRGLIVRFDGDAGTRSELQFAIRIVSGNLVIAPYASTTNYDMTFSSVPLNQWNHCALVRTGSTFYAYLNGVRNATTQTIAGNLNNGTWETWIGGYREGGVFSYQLGYIANARILKGTALYTGATYTVPTAPLTAVSGTELLCNFTNAGIFDQTGKNNLETVGNAQIDTTVKKYGTGSLEFDGNDYIVVPVENINWEFGGGAFTVEFWAYLTGVATDQYFMFHGLSGSGGSNFGWNVRINTSGQVVSYVNGTAHAFTDLTLSANTWHHIAICGNGSGVLNAFLDGVKSSTTPTYTSIVATPTSPLVLGGFCNSNVNIAERLFMTGFLDDLRITKGVARYTTTFTPPDKAFPDL